MDEAAIVREISQIKDAVEDRTGLRSRWRGQVILMSTAEMTAARGSASLAEKRWSCDIVINTAILPLPIRLRTFLHEIMHSVSVGTNEADYKRFRGWEEGVVEQMQRHLRWEVMQRFQMDNVENACREADTRWSWNSYIEALESLRVPLGIDPALFYGNLLATPLKDRLALVRSFGVTLEQQRHFVYTVGKLR